MDKYEKAIRVAELTAKSLGGELPGEEAEELRRLTRELQEEGVRWTAVTDLPETARAVESQRSWNARRVWAGVEKAIGRRTRHLGRRLARWAAVVAGIAVIAGAFRLVQERKEAGQRQAYIADAYFEPNKTVLELPGGERIAIDTLENVVAELNRHGIVEGDGAALGYAGDTTGTDEAVEYHRVSVPRGSEYSLHLADGTDVWLFAESEIYFPTRFRGRTREVYLKGEAFFDVKHDERHPFVVRTKALDVKVLGTSFNVKAYPGTGVVETSLVEGRVSLKGQVLRPDMQAVYSEETGEITYRPIRGENYRLRTEKIFVFDQERLDVILEELARWYDFTVFYQNPEMAGKRFGFKLEKYESVRTLLDILELTGEVAFDLNGKTLVVKTGLS